MTLLTHDIRVQAGSNVRAFAFRFKDEGGSPFPLAGSEFVLRISHRGWTLRRSTAEPGSGLALDPATAEVSWTPSLPDSRAVPTGRLARFELERRIGAAQEIWVEGAVTGLEGINDD